MRLAVVCPHFEPDVAPTGEVMTRIAHELVARGHHLHVVTTLPWYAEHRVEDGWDGRPIRIDRSAAVGRVTRLHPLAGGDKRALVRRAVGFAGFSGGAGLLAAATRGPVDGVLAMSPPITLGLAGKVAASLRRVPLVFNIQDVFPDVTIELGLLTNPVLIRAARAVERLSYAAADAVTVLSDDLRDAVAPRMADGSKVRVIPNFVDAAWIRPGARENAYRREFGLTGKRVVMYAGNVGFSQSLDLLVAAARDLRERDDVVFVVNGAGSALDDVKARAAGLPNVRFVGYQPRERLPEVLAAADVHCVLLKPGLGAASVPSKTYSVLAAGRPLVASIDPGTEVPRLLERSGGGIATPAGDAAAFTAAVRRLVDDPAGAEAMGAGGRRFVEQWLTPARVAEAYEELFAELIRTRAERA